MTDNKLTEEQLVQVLDLLHKRILHSKFAAEVTEAEILGLVEAKNIIIQRKAEKEALINGQETLQKHIAEQNAEIERLNLENLQMVASIKHLKSEARKVFAEKLKGKATYFRCRDGIKYVVSISDIDNLLKEMEGE